MSEDYSNDSLVDFNPGHQCSSGQANVSMSGFIVPDPNDVVNNYDGYYIYLLNEHDFKGVAADLVVNFDEYAARIGGDSAIIRGINQESYFNSLRNLFNRDPWYARTIGDLKSLAAGLFITKPGIQDFRAEKGSVFIYASQEVINDAYKYRIELSEDIVDLCKHNSDTFITRMLKYSRGSAVSRSTQNEEMLKTINDSIIFEPNIGGIGFDVKPLAKNIFSRFRKDKDSKPRHCCVVYRF